QRLAFILRERAGGDHNDWTSALDKKWPRSFRPIGLLRSLRTCSLDPPQMLGGNLIGRMINQHQGGIAARGLVCGEDSFRSLIEVHERRRKRSLDLLHADGADNILRSVLDVSGLGQISG